ncbi:DUF4232 domain-containing protein [Dactylosporangium sp. NPDC000244]|uniref:DUF4232 domain-containing protein n=1 Tax=Dactylosporangium sp. NPDC000244 TaxID=3154365 RepID=UPI003327086A
MTRTRALLAIAPFALLLGSAAGCGSDGDGSAAPGGSALPGSQAPSDAPPVSGASEPSGGASPTGGSGGGGDSGRCHHGEVRLAVQDAPGGGAAGSQYTWIVLTNTSSRTCTVYGFPGVSWVTGDSGQQVNKPAERDTAVSPKRVELAPGKAAHAQVGSPQTGNFGDECKPVQVRGYRVYLPDETAADFVPAPQTVCSADGVGLAHVGPVVAGTSQ